jgi:hypothetical protein
MFAWILIHVCWFLQSHLKDYLLFNASLRTSAPQVTFLKKEQKKFRFGEHRQEHLKDVYKSQDLREHLNALELALRPYWTFKKPFQRSRIMDMTESMNLSMKGYLPQVHHLSCPSSNARKMKITKQLSNPRFEGGHSNYDSTEVFWTQNSKGCSDGSSSESEDDLMLKSQRGPKSSSHGDSPKKRKFITSHAQPEQILTMRESIFSYLQYTCHRKVEEAEELTIHSSVQNLLPLYFSIATVVSPPQLRLLDDTELTHVRFRQVSF